MSRRSVVLLSLLGLLILPAMQCFPPPPPRPAARVASGAPGSCDGFLDYAGELVATGLEVTWLDLVAPDVAELEVSFTLENTGGARFRSASATLDAATASELGVLPGSLPADFGAIEPHGSAPATARLRLQLPAAAAPDLLVLIRDGALPLAVHADEENVLAPGVEIHDWTATEDRMYWLASQPSGGFGGPINVDPGPGPFAPGAEFGAAFVEFLDDVHTVFDDFQPGEQFYLVENPDSPLANGPLVNIPDAYDRVRVVDATRIDEADDDATIWMVTLKRTDDESLPSIFSTASFCTGTSTHIDPPVQASRLLQLDGAPVDPETSDRNPHPIRFNDIPFGNGAVQLSGQVEGHVLKPSLALRLRDGRVEAQVDVDTDLSLTAELEASAEASFAPEDRELYSLCFPLPSLTAGPVDIPMNLQLVHSIGVEASIGAGAVVGFEKHFASGFHVTCEGGPGVAEDCWSEPRRTGTPIQFTPPRLSDDTAAHARVATTLEAALRVGSPYPLCDTGAGASFEATAYGTLDVEPTQDPWWSVGYGLDTWAGLELQLLGLEIARYGSEISPSFEPAPSSADPAVRSSGEDQRWAVAIDDVTVPSGVSATAIAALPDGSSVAIASEAIGGRTPLVKLDRFGALAWVKELAVGKVPRRVRALPDGSFVVVGSNLFLARLDAAGDLLWSFDGDLARSDLTSARCVLADAAVLETSPGHYDYVAVGRMGANAVTSYDACALRVNEDGTVPWARIYTSGGVQEFTGAVATRDGEVAAVGTDFWSYVGNRAIPLIAKLDAASGDVVWWKGLPMTRLAGLEAVTEAPDGTLFAVGGALGTIYTTGASLVARIAPDGSDARHAFLFQDEDWEALLDFETWIDTAGGDTAYDAYSDIAPSGDGFVIAGTTGNGAPSAARVAKVNANLGVEWIATYDGASSDAFTGVAAAPDGLFVSGTSVSLPQPGGGSGDSQLWVLKLPFAGTLDFLPTVAMTTRFVEPGVRSSSVDPGVNPLDQPAIDSPYASEDAVVVSAGPGTGLVVPASPYCVGLLTATGHVTTTDTCAD